MQTQVTIIEATYREWREERAGEKMESEERGRGERREAGERVESEERWGKGRK